jgi:transcription termination/antitermination protein NusG
MSGTLMAGACEQQDECSCGRLDFSGSVAKPWFALAIRQRSRHRCEAHLESLQCPMFSPTYRELRAWSDRKVKIEVPLFPGYIFCSFDPSDAWKVVRTPGIIEIVNSAGRMLEVDPAQLDAIKRSLDTGRQLEVVSQLFKGQRVRIVSGPMAGVEGILTLTKQGPRVALEITMMNRSVLVEVDRTQLVAANEPQLVH